ncbi:LuxR family transcriptional regulator [Sphingomonas sp. MG17]|uniref:LuxR family transcriptional regulator n=1 Tax=Sphingomonas tagetis TaxID=2949092 RepID=A0A9X2KMX4_9SPHN|nr:LuxR family transcriptional regulator [Sphingomonas tagetis]MCP3732162.1 LuxR family transcriptional regulator [Sphingomonas tagetis]
MHSNLHEEINRFLSAHDSDQLQERLEAATHDLGFKWYAMGHHVDLRGSPEDALRLSNYPTEWIERSLSERYYANDPIHRASTRTATGFLWSEVSSLIRLTRRDRDILKAASSHGLGDGFTVPVHVPGEYRGTCSFGTTSLDHLARGALPVASMISSYAFEAGRRILRVQRRTAEPSADVPMLTDRQRDTLVLVARGKADPEIATLLGISPATAHEHVENVRRLYGNAQRPFLVVRALFDGQISFSEVLRR